MKKIFVILTMIFAISCSVINGEYFLTNGEINEAATKKINVTKNLVVARASLENIYTRVENGKIISEMRYYYDVLGGAVTSNTGRVIISADAEVRNNALYLKNTRVLKITSAQGLRENEAIASAITSMIANSLEFSEIYNFEETYMGRRVVDVKLVNRGMVLILR